LDFFRGKNSFFHGKPSFFMGKPPFFMGKGMVSCRIEKPLGRLYHSDALRLGTKLG
jgi:hypothetical protein